MISSNLDISAPTSFAWSSSSLQSWSVRRSFVVTVPLKTHDGRDVMVERLISIPRYTWRENKYCVSRVRVHAHVQFTPKLKRTYLRILYNEKNDAGTEEESGTCYNKGLGESRFLLFQYDKVRQITRATRCRQYLDRRYR